MTDTGGISRDRAIVLNRIITSAVVSMAYASYFWQPVALAGYIADILSRAYLHFLAGSMGHEAAHGHLGRNRVSNIWWGRFAFLPTTAPFVTFRKTHIQHHAATNVSNADPDAFMNTTRKWEIPFRALLLPSHWVWWLWRHGRFSWGNRVEYVVTLAVQLSIYVVIANVVGMQRVILGLIPSGILHSFVLWYFFAVKTHEGYSTGPAVTRSHNYYGRRLYWLTCGLSMHRLHHMKPGLAWLQMAGAVPDGTLSQRLRFQRDVVRQGAIQDDLSRFPNFGDDQPVGERVSRSALEFRL
jgi:fatty acid desaturase